MPAGANVKLYYTDGGGWKSRNVPTVHGSLRLPDGAAVTPGTKVTVR
jgi:hypothetical protein